MIEYKKIGFQEVLPVWKTFLWPDRTSPIESHSAIVYLSSPYEYDTEYFNNVTTFVGAFLGNELVGVNSGHMTQSGFYRSRGLYVFEKARGLSIGKGLLVEIQKQASEEGAAYCWSMPRLSSLPAYKSAGFIESSEPFGTETSDLNVYAISRI